MACSSQFHNQAVLDNLSGTILPDQGLSLIDASLEEFKKKNASFLDFSEVQRYRWYQAFTVLIRIIPDFFEKWFKNLAADKTKNNIFREECDWFYCDELALTAGFKNVLLAMTSQYHSYTVRQRSFLIKAWGTVLSAEQFFQLTEKKIRGEKAEAVIDSFAQVLIRNGYSSEELRDGLIILSHNNEKRPSFNNIALLRNMVKSQNISLSVQQLRALGETKSDELYNLDKEHFLEGQNPNSVEKWYKEKIKKDGDLVSLWLHINKGVIEIEDVYERLLELSFSTRCFFSPECWQQVGAYLKKVQNQDEEQYQKLRTLFLRQAFAHDTAAGTRYAAAIVPQVIDFQSLAAKELPPGIENGYCALWGRLLEQQGNLAEAREHYQALSKIMVTKAMSDQTDEEILKQLTPFGKKVVLQEIEESWQEVMSLRHKEFSTNIGLSGAGLKIIPLRNYGQLQYQLKIFYHLAPNEFKTKLTQYLEKISSSERRGTLAYFGSGIDFQTQKNIRQTLDQIAIEKIKNTKLQEDISWLNLLEENNKWLPERFSPEAEKVFLASIQHLTLLDFKKISSQGSCVLFQAKAQDFSSLPPINQLIQDLKKLIRNRETKFVTEPGELCELLAIKARLKVLNKKKAG